MKKLYTLLLVSGLYFATGVKAQVTTYNDVASIFYNKCAGCHHTGGIAPMSFMTYSETKSFTSSIVSDLNSGKMPPWQPDTAYGSRFMHESIVTKPEKDLIIKWVNDNATEGDPTKVPVAPVFDDYAHKLCPEPSMILKINDGKPYTLAHDEGYDCFVVKTNLPKTRYLRAYEIVPGNSEIVHHVVIAAGSGFIGTTGGGCAIAAGAGVEMGTYVPNSAPTVWPDKPQLKCGMKFAPNTELNLQIHYAPGCQGKTDNITEVRLYFYPEGDTTGIRDVHTTVDIEKVAFGQAVGANQQGSDVGNYSVTSSRSILGIFPHAHLVCDAIKVDATSSGQPTIPFINIPKWYFDWAGYFFYKKLIKLPSGYTINATNHYNNTASNPIAPNRNAAVMYGTSTTQEMLYQAFQWMDYKTGDENIDLEALLKCDTLLVCRPKAAGAITGTSSFCGAQTGKSFITARVVNAVTYTWTYTGTGATIHGNSNSVTIDFAANATSGNLMVAGVNQCGVSGVASPVKAITIAGGAVAAAGTITGSSSVCKNQTGVTYSVPAISGASSYIWAYSGTGATITGTTNSVTIDFGSGATSGNLTVTGSSSCGNGTVSANYAVTVNATPTTPTVTVQNNCGSSDLTSSATTGTYLWSPGGATTQMITVTTGGNYAVTVSTGGSCSATSTSTTVTIKASPSISNPAPASRCGTGTVSLGATASTGTINWYTSATGGTSVGTGASFTTPSLTATTTYYVDASDVTCTSTPRTAIVATVNNGPTAAISGSATVCKGSTSVLSVALTGKSPWAFSYGTSAGSNAVTNITTSTYTVAAGTGTYTVANVSDASGCTGSISGSSAVITENAAIVVSNITTTCSNGNYTVDFDMAGGDGNYTVSGGTGNKTTNTHYTSAAITSGTNYSFSVTDGKNCTPVAVNGTKNCGCSATAAISGGGTICTGSVATITVTLAGTSPWKFTYAVDGLSKPEITNVVNSTYTFTTSTSGAYTLVSVADASCTAGSTSGTATVSKTQPTATISGGGSACAGATVNLSFDLTSGSAPWSLIYGIGATTYTVSSSSSSNISVPVSVGGTYSIVSVTAGTCSGTGSGSKVVTINALPTVGGTASPSATVCSGSDVTLNGTGAVSYIWSDGVTEGAAFKATASKTYTVTGTDANNCSNKGTQSIVVVAGPTVTQTASPSSAAVCAGSNVILTAGGTATQYSWSGGVIDGQAFAPISSATYTLTGIDDNNCSSTTTRKVTVFPLPNVGIIATPSVVTICAGDSISLSGTGAKTYTWSGGVVNGARFTPTGSDVYTVTGKDASSCENTASYVIEVVNCELHTIGINEVSSSLQQITVYPNPNNGLFNISVKNANFKALTIIVVNMLGEEVFTASDKNNSTDYHAEVNLESLPKGVYYIKLSTGVDNVIKKLIIQ
jgi:Ig-like domain CHU_C associated/PKD-like domain/Secretion system C-terminal sorting domain